MSTHTYIYIYIYICHLRIVYHDFRQNVGRGKLFSQRLWRRRMISKQRAFGGD